VTASPWLPAAEGGLDREAFGEGQEGEWSIGAIMDEVCVDLKVTALAVKYPENLFVRDHSWYLAKSPAGMVPCRVSERAGLQTAVFQPTGMFNVPPNHARTFLFIKLVF
jgi:hypothetical protein